ncbi:tumor necrosis factor b (TNF superfamily, member 2) [Danio aesculapii]|uniref:tumor necrosis factor b (TNF superfamily, member 2) n=1 Tax=Danio aesculapii TaxID=1142201 RepID=UPI0024BF25AD|nr:tumor necrosis factor b (TNF superfamily, member 2) [Danio aesculapii]
MVRYETTLVDMEAGVGGVYQTTVAPVPVKSSRSWIWKTLAAVAFISLCIVAALFFTCHVMKPNEEGQKPNRVPLKQQVTTPSASADHGKVLKQIAESTKAAIHLHGGQSGKSLKWVGGVDQSFEQGGLRLENNEIIIPEDGLYFVYSQVSYETLCAEDVEGDGQKYLSHSINRYTNALGKKMPLQNSAHSVCPSLDGKKTYSTIYLGAIFNLFQDDRLSTNTSRVGDIEDNYAKTFFGVFAL